MLRLTSSNTDFSPFKSLQKVECLFLEDEKIVLTLNTFFKLVSLFDAEGSVHDSMDDVVRILGR